MPEVIRLRDVVRGEVHELGPETPILRGPYELFQPVGSVRRRDGLVEWTEAGATRSARVAPAELGDAHPGERVLLRLPPGQPQGDEWWLCEVEAVDGNTVNE
jgi:hypothetical protein